MYLGDVKINWGEWIGCAVLTCLILYIVCSCLSSGANSIFDETVDKIKDYRQKKKEKDDYWKNYWG